MVTNEFLNNIMNPCTIVYLHSLYYFSEYTAKINKKQSTTERDEIYSLNRMLSVNVKHILLFKCNVTL